MPPFPLPLYPTSQPHVSSRQRRCLSPVQNISSTTADVVKSNNSDLSNCSNSSNSNKNKWESAEKSAISRVNYLSENMEILPADADYSAILDENNVKSDVVTSSNVAAQAKNTQISVSHSDLTSVHKLKTKKTKMMNTTPLVISSASLAKSEESLFTIKPRSVKMRAPLPLCSNEHNDNVDNDNDIGSNANKQHKVHQNTIHEKDVLVDDDNDEDEDENDGVVFTDVQCTEQKDRNNLVLDNNNYDDDNNTNNVINNGVITEELLRD